jgi:hypothetical protein
MTNSAQKRAIKSYRERLTQRGFTRFEIVARADDREMIRALARRLAEDGPEAEKVRTAMKTVTAGESPRRGGILAALRRSPLVGSDLDLVRARDEGRQVDL